MSFTSKLFDRIAGWSSIAGLGLSAFPLLRGIGDSVPTWAPLTTLERANMLLWLSVLTVTANGIAWIILERLFRSNYGPGPRTPKGIHAIILSLTLTVPAMTMPVLYQMTTAQAVVAIGHFHAALLALPGGAVAYVLLFGTDERVFPGLREIVLRRFRAQPLMAEGLATLVYAFVLVVLIATPYRLLVQPESTASVYLLRPLLAAFVVFFGTMAYILLKYPDSLRTPVWVHTRGIIAGLFTAVSVCTALYA